MEAYFENDELFHIYKHIVQSDFCSLGDKREIRYTMTAEEKQEEDSDQERCRESEKPFVMIEYAGGKSEKNDVVIDRRPIYVGGFTYDKHKNELLRHGKGKVLNEFTGVCEQEGTWNNGEEVSIRQTRKRQDEDCPWSNSLRMIAFKDKAKLDSGYWNTPIALCSGYSVSCGVIEIVVPNNSSNEEEMTDLIIKDLPLLTTLSIGSDCFQKVRCFKIMSLYSLQKCVIGMDSFQKGTTELGNGEFKICNCNSLGELSIGDGSFYDFNTFEIKKCNSLISIQIGGNCFYYTPRFELTRNILLLSIYCRFT